MFRETWALMIAVMAASAQANDAYDDQLVDNMLNKLVYSLYDRVLSTPAQDEDLESSTLAKPNVMSVRASPGHVGEFTLAKTAPLAPVSPYAGARLPAASIVTNSMHAGTGNLAGYQCYPAIVNAEVAKKKKKGVKIVDGREIPFNVHSVREPLKAKVVKNDAYPQTITENTGDPNWETVHVTFDHGGKYPYLEGMSLGLIAPGPDKTGKKPAAIRLYSIASSAVGDDETSKTVSLCVKRVVECDGKFANREVGEDKPDKAGTVFKDKKVYRGVASNFICDLNVGDEVLITGPVGTEMLLPQDPESVIIMLATGTGIAPMRSYTRLLFNDKAGKNPDGSLKFKGLAWLFLGVPFSKSLLYDDENVRFKKEFPDQFRYEYAISREQKSASGQKMYIQTKVQEYAEEVWDLLQYKKTHVYICGLKGMEKGMEEALGPIAKKNGLEWNDLVKAWKKEDRWHVEVY
jgi:ferredoxin--NADP+ reductase